jgi:predicted transcriptional regulator
VERTHVTLAPGQLQHLKRIAKIQTTTKSNLIRQAVDAFLREQEGQPDA